MALIEIDGLPINSMVIFHGYVSHNQLVYYKQLTKWDEPPFTVYCLVIKPGMLDATVSARDL